MSNISRRGFLAAAAASAALTLPARVRAASDVPTITATTRTIEVKGRAATVHGLMNGRGGLGLVLDPGQRFRVDLTNRLKVETIVHWHGQIPPNAQDGVPNTNPMLKPGETRAYDFAALPGTYWMHSHIPVQEVGLLAAPLVVRSAADLAADRQEVVLFLHDFSFKAPEEVLAEVTGGAGMDHAAMGGGMMGDKPMSGMNHARMPGMGGAPAKEMPGMGGTGSDHHPGAGAGQAGAGQMMDMGQMGSGQMGSGHMGMMRQHMNMMGAMGMGNMEMGAMDLNDIDFDAYLANDRTLDDPEVIRVERGGRVRLRAINGSSMTVFWIDLGATLGRLVACDGEPCQPLTASRFGFAPGQRLDIEIDLPADGTALPVLALREGARERTGIVLAPAGAAVTRIDGLSQSEHPAFSANLIQEATLRAVTPLAFRPPDRTHIVMLAGSMQPYVWTIDGRTWADHAPLPARRGERVEMVFNNMSMMAHPMHLHGHRFQVVGIGTNRIAGALRDTVHVPPMSAITIAVDAGEAAPWMLHCHHMGHLETGMMTEFAVA